MCQEFDMGCWMLMTIKNKGTRLPVSVDMRKEKENYKCQPCDKCHSQDHSAASANILCFAY